MFGQNESVIVRRLAEQESPKLVTFDEAFGYMERQVSRNSFAHTMSYLASKGIVEKVGKGLYINRSGSVSPKITELIPNVFKDVQYYVGLNAAANYWGLTSQIPNVYHVVYPPNDEATKKRVERWCAMLNRNENLGAELRPIKAKTRDEFDIGITRKVLDVTELPISNIERTIVDGVAYTEEIGGPDEILRWARVAANAGLINRDEILRQIHSVGDQLSSITARFGFLLTLLLNQNLVARQNEPAIRRLSERFQNLITGNPTYQWGRSSETTQYFNQWRLRVSDEYMRQLNLVTLYE